VRVFSLGERKGEGITQLWVVKWRIVE